jgi:glycosyltransferase involved in cell wall biosynthesis
MQIEVVDDASDDDPEAVVRAVAGDRVAFLRHPRNLGHVANFHACLVRSRGEIVHLLHGDDLVRPGFYTALSRGFEIFPELGAAFCRSVYIDADGAEMGLVPAEQAQAGLLQDALARLASEQRIMTPSIVVRRAVYEALGGFDRRLVCSEDWEMWVRIAARFPIWYEPQPLALYRVHTQSNTGRHVSTADDMAFTRKAIAIFADYLPSDRAGEITSGARRTYAATALEMARRLRGAGDRAGSQAQIREALRLAPSLSTACRALAIIIARSRADAPSR